MFYIYNNLSVTINALLIQSKCGKIRTKKTPKADIFHTAFFGADNNEIGRSSFTCLGKIILYE